MAIFYKEGFFNNDFGGFVPEGAVEITPEEYEALLIGQAEGKRIIANSQGKPILIEPAPSPQHEWNGTAWVISPEKQAVQFEQKKTELLRHIAEKTDRLKAGLLVGYPQTEIESFYRQEKEALAWQADNTTPTPMLTQIAKMRGVPFELLVEKVIEKSAQFAVAIGIIIGQRQRFEDRLQAAKTIEQLAALEQEINLWQTQTN